MRKALAVLFFLPVLLFAQSDKKEGPWAPFKFFVGRWEGTGSGQPGISKVEREYRFVLGGKFLKAENKSTYEPQAKNSKGEVHEDLGLFSYDSSRKKFVLRQFHGEGFINQYVLDSLSPDGKTIMFATESIENLPTGWRAREVYRILSDSEFVETFSLAGPGKQFDVYSESHLKRKR